MNVGQGRHRTVQRNKKQTIRMAVSLRMGPRDLTTATQGGDQRIRVGSKRDEKTMDFTLKTPKHNPGGF